MNIAREELFNEVENFLSENLYQFFSQEEKVMCVDFAQWLLSQKLEHCSVKRRFSLEEFIWSKVFPTEPYNADDYYDWARENANRALEIAYEYSA